MSHIALLAILLLLVLKPGKHTTEIATRTSLFEQLPTSIARHVEYSRRGERAGLGPYKSPRLQLGEFVLSDQKTFRGIGLGAHVRFRRVQTLVREGSPLVKLRGASELILNGA